MKWICRLVGHAPGVSDVTPYRDYRGFWRSTTTVWPRCGVEGHEAFGATIWTDIRRWWWERCQALKLWWRVDCHDCGRPIIRFNRCVGDHSQCDDIPF